MKRIESAAGVYSLGFSVGVFSSADVIAWADSEVSRADELSESLISLSEAKSRHPLDMVALLHALAGHDGTRRECEVVLGLLSHRLKQGKMTPLDVARAADKLGEIPEDGHWPDRLMNADSDNIAALVNRLAQRLQGFEERADEWRRSVQPSSGGDGVPAKRGTPSQGASAPQK